MRAAPKPTKPMSIAHSTELHSLKRTIKNSNEIVTDFVKQSRERGQVALGEALLCGVQLLRARELVGPSGFDEWVSKNFKDLQVETAMTFLKLAKSQARRDALSDRRGQREAYAALGIV